MRLSSYFCFMSQTPLSWSFMVGIVQLFTHVG